ncbi:MAG: zinc transporter permease [Acidimicrobiia bacterium]
MTETENQAEHTLADHTHGEGCGHDATTHEGHVDYLHDGHKHALHGDHYDEH